MQREEKSERSRRAVLDAALRLFADQGYRATTMREIADAASVSTGNVYHHFPDKETIFQELLDEYFAIADTQRFPFRRALGAMTDFPDNIEQLGFAARDSIRQYRDHNLLIYVDVIEFGGTHIQKFYGEMGERFMRMIEEQGTLEEIKARLRPNVSPVSALLLTTRMFFNYFSVEILFGVDAPFGKDSREVVEEIADIIRNGVCAR
ncbi:MAG TPA: TetR/AcrR family transcriptional regulator [Thermoanaerobaculia bacterium]|jgi:AcrR family transcriptional regulator|nr:TetR/AcrR family transcriptional regulator [Thermoanaerobaculia bacterium]